jgi:REP element-mobilizing transposase RayT
MAHLTHLYEPGMTYLLTSVTHRREPIFAEIACAQAAHEDITFYTRKFKAASLAHVIMPEHIHWVIYPSYEDFKRFAREEQEKNGKYAESPERFYLSKIMEDYKRHVSFAVNELRGAKGAQVWQDGFRDDGLRTVEIVKRAVRYVVFNPVEAGIVPVPEEYPYLAWDAAWLV